VNLVKFVLKHVMTNFVRNREALTVWVVKRVDANDGIPFCVPKKESRDFILGGCSLYSDAKTGRDLLNVYRGFRYVAAFQQ